MLFQRHAYLADMKLDDSHHQMRYMLEAININIIGLEAAVWWRKEIVAIGPAEDGDSIHDEEAAIIESCMSYHVTISKAS